MYAAITLFVSLCFASTAAIYFVLHLRHRRRRSDLWLGVIGSALALTYALYTFESAAKSILHIEMFVDGVIGLILLWNLRKLVKFTFMERPDAGNY